MSARGFLGGGDLYIDRYDPLTGLKVGREGPFETGKFEIKPNVDLKEMASKGRATYGQVIESVPIPKPSDFSVELNEVDRAGLTLVLMGTQAALNQGSGAIANEAVTAKLDKWAKLSKQNFAEAGFVVTNQAGTTTYALGTDYLVNYRLGMIKPLTAGAIAADEVLNVDGSYNAISGIKISGGTQPQLRAEFVLDGINFADSTPVIVTAHEVVLTPDNGFNFMADDFGKIVLKGRMKTPAGFAEPYTVELRDAA